MDVRLGPMSDGDQRSDTFSLTVAPTSAIRRYVDGFGNSAHLITIARPHRALEIIAQSEVQTLLDDPFASPRRPPAPLGQSDLADYLSPSLMVPRHEALHEMAEPYRPETPDDTFAAVQRLTALVHDTFTYRRHATTVASTVVEVIAHRTGVCQDFTHVLIGLCRAVGVPARYVSGYTVADGHDGGVPERDMAPGDPGASHAWVEAYTPTHGWRGFDPTNNLVASTAHVKMATGRDYKDVPPTRGTFRGIAEEHLRVAVETRSID